MCRAAESGGTLGGSLVLLTQMGNESFDYYLSAGVEIPLNGRMKVFGTAKSINLQTFGGPRPSRAVFKVEVGIKIALPIKK
jgi:hypothetical protein